MPNHLGVYDYALAACDDRALIQMSIDGRSDCFHALMDRHSVAVKRQLRLMIRNKSDLDDVMQEVLIKVWLHLATFRAESSLRTWMIRIAMNEARQLFRKSQCRQVYQTLDHFDSIPSPAESAYQSLVRTEAGVALETAIAELPQNYREVVVLRNSTGLRGREIAERLQTTVSSVKTRLCRARLMLSKRLVTSGARGHQRQLRNCL